MDQNKQPINITQLPTHILKKILYSTKFTDILRMYEVPGFRKLCGEELVRYTDHFMDIKLSSFEDDDRCILHVNSRNVLDYAHFTGFQGIMRFLNFYHPYVRSLNVDFAGASKTIQKFLIGYIAEYCHSTLVNLHINNLTISTIFPSYSFERIESVEFFSCRIGGTLSRLLLLFSNAREIKLSGNSHIKGRYLSNLIAPYPNLEYMKISPSVMCLESYKELCNLNRHIFIEYSRY